MTMGLGRPRLLVSAILVAALAAGCGSSSHATASTADPAAVSVIRDWAAALRRGDVNRAAAYFALPSHFVNGADTTGAVPLITIHDRAEAEAINATLPCGAILISARQRHGYIDALFRLTDRAGVGAGCGSGVGQLARTDFVIVRGHIVDWIRAPLAGPNPGIPSPRRVIPAQPSSTNPSV